MIDLIYHISGDSKGETSRKYLRHAITAYGAGEDTAAHPFFTRIYVSRYASGQSGDTKSPDMLQTRGEATQCVTSLINSVTQTSMQSYCYNKSKAKQAYMQLFYKARESVSAQV